MKTIKIEIAFLVFALLVGVAANVGPAYGYSANNFLYSYPYPYPNPCLPEFPIPYPYPGPGCILYVKWDATGTNNGSSWTDAYTDLQSALSAASNGDEIWVAAGTYYPSSGTNRSASFDLKNGVAIYGGFAGTETLLVQRDFETYVTILSGDLNNNDNDNISYDELTRAENSYHVVIGTGTNASSVLDGFTIKSGHANGGSVVDRSGGGMQIGLLLLDYSCELGSGGSPTIANVIFEDNTAYEGGGIYLTDYSNPNLTNVIFRDNTAKRGGGGVLNIDCSNPSLTNVTFNNNTAAGGGGMFNDESSPTLVNVTFTGNMGIWDDSIGGGFGGGLVNTEHSNPILTNVTFSGNSASDYGGAISNFYDSNPIIRNTILWANTAPVDAQIYNAPDLVLSSPVVDHSVVEGGYAGGTNIITADPLLGTLGNYGGFTETIPLLSGSSAIDAGDDGVCPATDQRGVVRPVGSHCDIGAYEYASASVDVMIGGVLQGNYDLDPNTGQVLKYNLDGGPVVIENATGTNIVASLNQWRTRPGSAEWTGVSQSLALPVDQLSNIYVMPRYDYSNTSKLYNAVLIANVDTVSRDISVKIAGVEMVGSPYTLGPSESQFYTYNGNHGGPVVVSSDPGAKIIASIYELRRDPKLTGWNGQSEMMGLPFEQLSNAYIIPIYFGAANPATLDARIFIANADTIATTVEVRIGGDLKGTYPLNPSGSQVLKYAVDGGPVEISSTNGAKIVASLNQWRTRPGSTEWTGVSQTMALPVDQLSNIYVMPRYDYSNTSKLYNAVLLANVDTVSRSITVEIGGVEMAGSPYTLGPSESQFYTYSGVAGGPVVVSSASGAKIIASIYELRRDPKYAGWNGQSEMMGRPFEQLSDSYIIPIYFGAASPATLDARIFIGVP